MANSFDTPAQVPAIADASAGQPFRARLLQRTGKAINASYAEGLRGGISQSWPSGIGRPNGNPLAMAFEWRVPMWAAATQLEIGLRHLASVGEYGFRLEGEAAPAGVAFGAGIAAMAWNAQAYTVVTFAVTPGTDAYQDLEMFLDDDAELYRASIGHKQASAPLATSVYSDGFEPFGTIATADAGAAKLWHQRADMLEVLAGVPTCFSAWSKPSDDMAGHAFMPPLFMFPVHAVGRARTGRTVRVWIKVALVAPATSGSIAVWFGTPTPTTTNRQIGRFMNSVTATDANGTWETFTFSIPDGFEILPNLPGGFVNIDTENNIIDAELLSISVWLE